MTIRTGIACGVFGLLTALPVVGQVPLPDTRTPTPTPAPVERILQSCLLSAPDGYDALPQVHQPQQAPFPWTPAERARLLYPYSPERAGQTMGWTLPDREYTAAIPLEAKVIPRDLSALPALKFNNLEIRGERELRWRSHGEYDQWFLRDNTRKLNALMAIHRETRRVYFFEYRWRGGHLVFDQSKESCYSCHASGPRLIRTYRLDKVDPVRLAEFNRKLLSYGAGQFGETVDPQRLGPALADDRCAGCHDGLTRGRLYSIHLPTVSYYLRTLHAMPPEAPLERSASDQLILGQLQRYRTALQPKSAGVVGSGQ